MNIDPAKKYFLNCFLLMLPVIIWNIALMPLLPAPFQPDIFRKDIPSFLLYAENGSRIVLFLLALLMPLDIVTARQKKGMYLYITGMLLYFASWIALIVFPDSGWSRSLTGFAAPAYTPLIWLTGVTWTGSSFYYFGLPYRRWHFMLASVLFLVFHNAHTMMVYFRLR